MKSNYVKSIKLLLPNKKYKKSYEDLLLSAQKNGDYEELGNASIKNDETFNGMIIRLKNRRIGKNINKKDVPATVYWIVVDNKIVGTIDLRHKLNRDYFERLGHVAYYIKVEERNKGYATKALSLAIKKYYKKYTKNILVTCFADNVASSKVIEKNGGILEQKIFDNLTNRYISKYIIKIREDDIVVPKTAWLTTNRTCNNKCNWCYALGCKDKMMNFDEIKIYVNELYRYNVNKIILIGGEPTIYEKIIEIVKYIANKGIEVSMASNGRKFSDFNFAKKLVNVGLKNCNISIKGSDEEEYIKNTNSIGFNEMIKGYKNLEKLGINVSTSFVLCDMNYQNFDKFFDSFIKNGLNNISFQLYKPSISEGENYNAPTIQELADLCKYVFNKIKLTNIKFSFEMSIPLCCLDEMILNEMIDRNCITTCCHLAKGTGIIFDSDFNILPCNHFVNHPLNNNKVVPQKILNFWNSEIPIAFRNKIRTYPHENCVHCPKWKYCGGGCFLRWLSIDPNLCINDKYLKGGD